MTDSRFVYGTTPKWQQGQNQKLQGTEILTIPASSKSPTLYEFELPNSNSVFLFGPNTGFKVKGVFEYKGKTEADTAYIAIPDTHYSKVALQPNWFENLIKSIDVFNNNASVKCDDVPRYADHILNTYLYSTMDTEVKDYLCPEAQHPARCVPTKKDWYSVTQNKEWHEYAKTVFGQVQFAFLYVPMFVFPFFQHAHFGANGGRLPNALPMSLIEKMRISMSLKENTDCIFKKIGAAQADIDGNDKVYRFRIHSIDLVIEEARLQPSFERTLTKRTTPLHFSGVTRYGRVENITKNVLSHRTEIKSVEYPEGVFIFALNEKVIGGDYKFSDAGSVNNPVFMNTNLESVGITYNGLPLAIKTPNYGTVRDQITEIKHYIAHKEAPPFGIPQDLLRLKLADIEEAGENSDFPHVYINLCPSLNETRWIAIGDDGRGINTPGNLEFQFKFRSGGATEGANYYIYLFYTDTNMTLDPRTKSFIPFYKRVRPAY